MSIHVAAEPRFPVSRLRRQAGIALAVLIALFGLYHLAIQPALTDLATGAPFINAYGRQRMLCQRLIKCLLAAQSPIAEGNRDAYLESARTTLTEWTRRHSLLISQDFGYLKIPEIALALKDLDLHVQRIRIAAEQFLDRAARPERTASNTATDSELTTTMLVAEPIFMNQMDRIVGMYENEVQRRVRELRFQGWGIFGLLVATACFLYAAVIAPAIRLLSALYLGNLSRYQTLVEHMTDGLALVDQVGTIEFINRRLNEMLGVTDRNITGERLDDFLMATPGARKSLLQSITSGNTLETTFRRDPQGVPLDAIVRCRPMESLSESSRPLYLCVISDITGNKQQQYRLRALQDQLNRVNRVQTLGEMSSALTHELGQPLGAISAFVGGCRHGLSTGCWTVEQFDGHLERIERATSRASEILKRFRGYGRRADFSRRPIDLQRLIGDVQELCAPMLAESRAALEVRVAPSAPTVQGDSLLLQQVLINLIQNSLQALGELPASRRTIRVEARHALDRRIQIEIRDRGEGLTAEHLERFQEPFFTSRPDGLGLGLAICRTIMEDHEGSLAFSSVPEQGSTVLLTFPDCTAVTPQMVVA